MTDLTAQLEDLAKSYSKALEKMEKENRELRNEIRELYEILLGSEKMPKLTEFKGVA